MTSNELTKILTENNISLNVEISIHSAYTTKVNYIIGIKPELSEEIAIVVLTDHFEHCMDFLKDDLGINQDHLIIMEVK